MKRKWIYLMIINFTLLMGVVGYLAMPRPDSAWSDISSGQVDADSPVDATLMGSIRTDLYELRQQTQEIVLFTTANATMSDGQTTYTEPYDLSGSCGGGSWVDVAAVVMDGDTASTGYDIQFAILYLGVDNASGTVDADVQVRESGSSASNYAKVKASHDGAGTTPGHDNAMAFVPLSGDTLYFECKETADVGEFEVLQLGYGRVGK